MTKQPQHSNNQSSDEVAGGQNANMHFEIAASVVRQLGEELISDEVTALVELAKNAWDADASWIHIEVVSAGKLSDEYKSPFIDATSYIILRDNGHGMSRDDIERGWLTISRSKKREMKAVGKKTKNGRTPLGDKGLGRLSTQRLGRNIDLITKEKGQPGHHIAFSWNDFTDDSVLTDVPISEIPNDQENFGTTLIISDLREPSVWQKKGLAKLTTNFSQLIFPFQADRPFSVHLNVDGEKIDLIGTAESVREAAASKYQFEFDGHVLTLQAEIALSKLKGNDSDEDYAKYASRDGGADFFAYLQDSKYHVNGAKYLGKTGRFISLSKSIRLTDIKPNLVSSISYAGGESENKENLEPASPGPFIGEMYEFNLKDQDQSAFDSFSDFKKYIKSHSGVRVFRDGFGIKPYGVEGNDWLKMGAAVTSGGSWYGMRTANTIGYIAISEEHNGQLSEKTDREGFVDNPYAANFISLMRQLVFNINQTLQSVRRGYVEYKKQRLTSSTGDKTSSETLTEIQNVGARSSGLLALTHNVREKIDEASKKAIELTNEVASTPLLRKKEDVEASRILETTLSSLNDARSVLEQTENLLMEASSLADKSELLKIKLDVIQKQSEDLAELAGLGLIAEALSHELEAISNRVRRHTSKAKQDARQQGLNEVWLNTYFEEVSSAVSALRKQLSHLSPMLRFVRETKQKIAIGAFCKSVIHFYKSQFSEDGIVFKLDNAGEDFWVDANQGRLTQVVDNIVINCQYWAKKAKADGKVTQPEVVLSFDKPLIRIFDNGEGVDESVEDIIFDPFVSMKPNNEGRGLGLFIVQQLLEPMKGEVILLHDRNSFGRRYVFQLDLSGILHTNEY